MTEPLSLPETSSTRLGFHRRIALGIVLLFVLGPWVVGAWALGIALFMGVGLSDDLATSFGLLMVPAHFTASYLLLRLLDRRGWAG